MSWWYIARGSFWSWTYLRKHSSTLCCLISLYWSSTYNWYLLCRIIRRCWWLRKRIITNSSSRLIFWERKLCCRCGSGSLLRWWSWFYSLDSDHLSWFNNFFKCPTTFLWIVSHRSLAINISESLTISKHLLLFYLGRTRGWNLLINYRCINIAWTYKYSSW